ncbi:MAG TPA: phosphopantetheine-binding protein [Oscillatoriaceae cyanobacterium]
MSRAAWLARLHAWLIEAQPGLDGWPISENTELFEELGLDSLAFEAVLDRLRGELGGQVSLIAWLNTLQSQGARLGVVLDLIEAHERAHAG